MLQTAKFEASTSLVQTLVRSGAIKFQNNSKRPLVCNFGTTFIGKQGPVTRDHVLQISECLYGAAADACDGCEAVVNALPHELYMRGSFTDPLVYAFAQRGILPMRLHQIRQRVANGKSFKILVVDTYAGDAMQNTVETLCGLSVEVKGVVFLRSEEDDALDERSITSIHTRKSLTKLCLKTGLIPPYCHCAVNQYLQKAA